MTSIRRVLITFLIFGNFFIAILITFQFLSEYPIVCISQWLGGDFKRMKDKVFGEKFMV